MENNKPITKRRANRIAALQFLYLWDFHIEDQQLEPTLEDFLEEQDFSREYYQFAEELIHGVLEHRDTIDDEIRKLAQNWQFSRIAKVDLAILRIAVYEIMNRLDIPPVVSINEAIELSKLFSIPESKRFINGILDQIKNLGNRPAREATAPKFPTGDLPEPSPPSSGPRPLDREEDDGLI